MSNRRDNYYYKLIRRIILSIGKLEDYHYDDLKIFNKLKEDIKYYKLLTPKHELNPNFKIIHNSKRSPFE